MPGRILVIDDSAMALELTVQALLGAGYAAVGAPDLASLDQRLSQGAYDLILVDVNMPEMFGDDVVEFLRVQKGVTAKLLLYSDLDEAQLQARVKTSGADGYIIKGKGLEWLLAEVPRLLGGPAAGAGAPPGARAGQQGGRKPRILIVDDSEMTARILEAELSSKGFEVLTADNAEKATRIILKKQTRPDLVLLDVRMPNVDGEQFCRFIKGNSLFRGIKVLLCSGENVEELKRICREAGADGYVPKDAVLSKVLASELPSGPK